MRMNIPANFKFLEPWVEIADTEAAVSRAQNLVEQLNREVGAGHVLYGLRPHAIAARIDQDDVLFALADGDKKSLAVVHLTWSNTTTPPSPRTKLFETWDDWVRDSMRPVHEDYIFPEKPDYETS
ncbi:MAG TPA: hypothetical protein VGR58_08115 [Candidatus Acidoferrum sp.]|nr:hypothetical protein [Candidatus Acidoferrum sp.]